MLKTLHDPGNYGLFSNTRKKVVALGVSLRFRKTFCTWHVSERRQQVMNKFLVTASHITSNWNELYAKLLRLTVTVTEYLYAKCRVTT